MEPVETESVYRGDLNKLLYKVRKDRGLDLHQYRRAYVERRLAARMRVLNLHTYRQYERYLDEHPDEYTTLLDTLTINVTDFFRDQTVYELFRTDVLPALLEYKTKTRQRHQCGVEGRAPWNGAHRLCSSDAEIWFRKTEGATGAVPQSSVHDQFGSPRRMKIAPIGSLGAAARRRPWWLWATASS